MAQLDESSLLSIIEQEEANCLSTISGKLAEQRREALQYYFGEPYGNEVDGRSQVVTTEVKDSIEDILPSLMKMYAATDEIVRCEPQRQEDEEMAQQATDYLNYLFMRQNKGVLILYFLFKDALLQKTGFDKVYWEEYSDRGKETYEGLNDLELALLMQEPDLELVEHEGVEGPVDPTGQPTQLHNVVFRRNKKYGKACIDPCPPEEILVSRDTGNDLTKSRFIEHRTLKTISELREMGYDVEDNIADYAPNATFNLERVERQKYDDAWAFLPDQGNQDPTTRRVWYCEAYLHVDFDGDGIAELRKVCKVGRKILDNEEIDSIPIIGGGAILMPHKFYGLSIHDLVKDIQLIKSTVTRQLLDNAYGANNGRMVVLDGMVNMDDLLTSRPNGIIRAKTLQAVQRLDTPLLGQSFYNLLDYWDNVKQKRIGATGFPNAVDPDAINAKAAFVDRFAEGAMERIALMARILGETAVKPIFEKLLELVSKHQQKPQMVKLRGKWVQVDPREWKDKFHMTVTVGLGTGSQQTVINGVQMLAQLVGGAVQMGLAGRVVSEQNAYELFHTAAKAVFPREADKFFTNPATLPRQQPQPNPDLIKLQLQKEKQDASIQQKGQKLQMDGMGQYMDFMLELKRMGIDVLSLAEQARQKNEDRLHAHAENSIDRVVDFTKHQETLKAQPATPSA